MTLPFHYQRLGYVTLGVTDVQRSAGFLRDIVGLDSTTDESPERASFRCSDRATNLVVKSSDEAGLYNAGFQLRSSSDLEAARKHFSQAGYDLQPISEEERAFLQIGDAFRLKEPITGVTFDYFSAMATPAKDFSAATTKIQRLGHVVIKTTRFEEAWQVMEKDFGFLASDYVDDKAVWMRCFPNPFHHSFAIINSQSNGLHHVNFMVTEIDDVGKARNRLMNAGVDIVYGPGRHKPSGSIFLYFTDPDGLTLEFSFGMEEFPPENAREPRMLMNSPEVMDLWGGLPKPEFGKAGAILKP